MKSIFKKVAIIIIAVTMGMAANAQTAGDMSVGGNFNIGFHSGLTNFGLGAKFTYNISDPIRLAGAFDFFFRSNYVTVWDAMVYGHYLCPVANAITVYPLAGMGIVGSSHTYGDSSVYFAFALGGGTQYALTKKLALIGEFKAFLTTVSTSFVISVGVAYTL